MLDITLTIVRYEDHILETATRIPHHFCVSLQEAYWCLSVTIEDLYVCALWRAAAIFIDLVAFVVHSGDVVSVQDFASSFKYNFNKVIDQLCEDVHVRCE